MTCTRVHRFAASVRFIDTIDLKCVLREQRSVDTNQQQREWMDARHVETFSLHYSYSCDDDWWWWWLLVMLLPDAVLHCGLSCSIFIEACLWCAQLTQHRRRHRHRHGKKNYNNVRVTNGINYLAINFFSSSHCPMADKWYLDEALLCRRAQLLCYGCSIQRWTLIIDIYTYYCRWSIHVLYLWFMDGWVSRHRCDRSRSRKSMHASVLRIYTRFELN